MEKGESSNHTKIVNIFLDCDNDNLLFKVIQEGVVCHKEENLFFYKSRK